VKVIGISGSPRRDGNTETLLTEALRGAGIELVEEGLSVKFVPLPEELKKCRLAGKNLAGRIKRG